MFHVFISCTKIAIIHTNSKTFSNFGNVFDNVTEKNILKDNLSTFENHLNNNNFDLIKETEKFKTQISKKKTLKIYNHEKRSKTIKNSFH